MSDRSIFPFTLASFGEGVLLNFEVRTHPHIQPSRDVAGAPDFAPDLPLAPLLAGFNFTPSLTTEGEMRKSNVHNPRIYFLRFTVKTRGDG